MAADEEPIAAPLTMPTRTELWRRNQLALSVLAHRPYTPETAALLERVLRGGPPGTEGAGSQ